MAYVSQFSNMDMSPVSLPRSSQSSPSKHRKRGKKNKARQTTDNPFDDLTDAYSTAFVGPVDPAHHDGTLVNALIDAMTDMSATEDNPGMLETWRKLVSVKAPKVRSVCEDLLSTMKRSHAQNGVPLGERKPVNLYPSFETRFEAVCNTLQTQKTVCKHLMEDPYSYQVVDDPLQALRRVQNNRRVNQQKKEVIDKGRQFMGEKAQGKGRPNLKLDVEVDDSLADDTVDPDSPIVAESDIVSEYAVTPVKRESPRKAGKKRARHVESDSEKDQSEQTNQVALVRPIKKRRVASKSQETVQALPPASNTHRSPVQDFQSAYSPPSNLQSVYPSPNNATSEDPLGMYESSLAGTQMAPSYLGFNQPLRNYFNHYPYGDMLPTHSGLGPNTFGQQILPVAPFSDQSMGYTSSNGHLFPDQPFDSSHSTSNQLNSFQYPLSHITPQ